MLGCKSCKRSALAVTQEHFGKSAKQKIYAKGTFWNFPNKIKEFNIKLIASLLTSPANGITPLWNVNLEKHMPYKT